MASSFFKDVSLMFISIFVVGASAYPVNSEDGKTYDSGTSYADEADGGDLAPVILCLGGLFVVLMLVVTAVRRKSSTSEVDCRRHCLMLPCCMCVSREETYREDDEEASNRTNAYQIDKNVKNVKECEKTGYLRKSKNGGKRQKYKLRQKNNTRTPTGYWGHVKKDETPEDITNS